MSSRPPTARVQDHLDKATATAASGRRGKVLVLGSGTGAFLSTIRSFGRHGLEVHAAWESRGAPALRSRYLHRFHLIEPYDPLKPRWIEQLASLMRREGFELVVPTDERSVRALSEHETELARWGRVGAPSVDTTQVLFDRAQTERLARSLGLRVVDTREVRTVEQGAALGSELGFPLELRHRRSEEPADRGVAWLPQTASGPDAYRRLLELMLQDGPLTVQQRIAGPLVGIGLLLDEGKPLMAVQYQHLHEPLHEPRGSYVTTVPLDPELNRLAARLMQAVSLSGFAAVEFRFDPAAGAWVMIDASPSLRGSLPAALAAGSDLPLGLYRLLVEEVPADPTAYRIAVHSRHLSGDMLWLLFKLRSGGNVGVAAVRLLPAVVSEFARNILRRREHLDAFARNDPAPLVAEASQTVGMGIKLVQRRARRRLATSSVVRRRLTRDARRAVRDADRVLFVCLGNICRSPFAEHRARDLVIFPEVASAGHDAQEGSRSPRLAVEAAMDWHVDLAPHRSRQLEEADVRAADAVFVFDEDNEQRLTGRFPFARDRVHYIGAISARTPLFVDDPFRGDLGVFQHSYTEIDAALNEMARIRGLRQDGTES